MADGYVSHPQNGGSSSLQNKRHPNGNRSLRAVCLGTRGSSTDASGATGGAAGRHFVYLAVGQNPWYHFGVGAPPILEPVLVGIGMFTRGHFHFHSFQASESFQETSGTPRKKKKQRSVCERSMVEKDGESTLRLLNCIVRVGTRLKRGSLTFSAPST